MVSLVRILQTGCEQSSWALASLAESCLTTLHLPATLPLASLPLQVGYVQSRWVFTNPAESYLTKAQEVGLNYHMKCEQYAHSAARSFFNFNGTAGE